MTLPEAAVEDLKGQLWKGHEAERDFYKQNVSRIQKELKKLASRMSVMYMDRLDGRITLDEYDKRVAVCKQQEATFLEQLKNHSEADEAFVISCASILELAKRAKELFVRSQPEQKNPLLRFVLANCSVEGEKLNYKLKSVFVRYRPVQQTKNWLPRLDSNQ